MIHKYASSEHLIASAMSETLKDPEFQSIFSPSAVLEKLAFKRVADEDKPTEIENELMVQLAPEQLETTASEETDVKADCVACGKKRAGWNPSMGVCKCTTQDGCSPLDGCKDGCSCGCKAKTAGEIMNDLIKSAFDSLLKASNSLEDAGFDKLATDTLILMNDLVVEAKAKKNKKDDKNDKVKVDKLKAKEKEAKDKAKMKAEKDKNAAKDKEMKEKARAKADKEKTKKSTK